MKTFAFRGETSRVHACANICGKNFREIVVAAIMGVWGLETLFREKFKKSKVNGWRKEAIGPGPLVVDGYPFCHSLYDNLSHTLAGSQYPEFSRQIRKHIRKFKECGIQPQFVFEGSDKTQKFTSEYRKKKVAKKWKEGSRFPDLAYTVLRCVLKEMEVPMYVADGEGDEACAQIAKHLNGPVLSQDSDFYLFDIPRGYINLKTLEFTESSVLADVYYRELFTQDHFPDGLLFLFPAILGNGIHPSTSHQLHIQNTADAACYYICGKRHKGNWLENLPSKTRNNFEVVRAYYNQGELDPKELLKAPIPKCPKVIPEWFLLSYRNKSFPFMIIDALVNSRQHHSSCRLTKCIRQVCYAILGVPEVIEYKYRPKERIAIEVPTVCAKIEDCLSLEEIDQATPDRKNDLLYSSLQCRPSQLETLREEERFFMCTVIFWKMNAYPPVYVIKALLACFLLCQCKKNEEIIAMSHGLPEPGDEKALEYKTLIEWQYVYNDALALSLLLQCDIPTLCPSVIYDGKIILTLANQKEGIDEYIKGLDISQENYSKMLYLLDV